MAQTRSEAGRSKDTPVQYEIVVEGHLDARWTRQFVGLAMTALPGDRTALIGLILDQAALHGILARIRDLGLTLVSVARREG